MTTRNSRAPTYADLARASAVIKRDLTAAVFDRLADVAEELSSVSVELHFSLDDERRVHVAGSAQASLALSCQLCMEPVARTVRVEVDGLLAVSESQAQQWRSVDAPDNIIVVSSAELDAAELVEDELLLQLPSRVCVEADCERRPVLSYGPADEPAQADTHRPFAALAELSKQLDEQKQ